jgi:hypothetical protein
MHLAERGVERFNQMAQRPNRQCDSLLVPLERDTAIVATSTDADATRGRRV